MRTALKLCLIALAVIAAGVVTIHLTSASAGDVGGDNLVTAAGASPTVASASTSTSTEPPTTTTTVDPAAVQAYLEALAAASTTTTTAPPPPPTTTAPRPAPTKPAPAPSTSGSGSCGGDLPPCYVMNRESGGNIRAKNPSSSASGKWQFLDSTWQGYGGYARAMDAPEAVQDARARALWAGGRGCSHWSAC